MIVDETDDVVPEVVTADCPRCKGSGKVLFVDPATVALPGSGRRRRPGPLRHGEPSRYSAGCRCDPCRAAWLAYRKARTGR